MAHDQMSMIYSKHNIFSKVYGSDDHFIVNILSGNADLMSPGEADRYLKGECLTDQAFVEKGYVVDPAEEERDYRKKYLDFIDARDTDEVQLFYVPNYSCNFDCSYCYQSGYLNSPQRVDPGVLEAFFHYIRKNFSHRKHYITIFGGEPLLPGNHAKEFFTLFLNQCRETETEVAVVTNGYLLKEYLPLFKGVRLREIQVTLDGTQAVHDRRRKLKNGGATFKKITEGIDLALHQDIQINLRMVVDRENLHNLPELARFAIQKGWTSHPLFKTQLGRNYELHFCQTGNDKLYSRIDLYKDLHALILKYPEILEFHKPAMSVSKFLFQEGKLPGPLFDACPGCKTEWAFDFSGKIYSCTATVGKAGEELGTFYPETALHEAKIDAWQERDILSIPGCRDCDVALACGGGCAMMAKHKGGSLHAKDCRPVKELLELGISMYSG